MADSDSSENTNCVLPAASMGVKEEKLKYDHETQKTKYKHSLLDVFRQVIFSANLGFITVLTISQDLFSILVIIT